MRAVFRVDGGADIGMGHIMRCLTLAEHLHCAGITSLFLGHPETLAQLQRLRPRMAVRRVPAGLSPVQDALHCRVLLARLHVRPDFLIVDHYGLGREWESRMRFSARRLLAMDDLGRAHAADMVVDTGLEGASRYRGRIPRACRLLLGPRYALLRDGFRQARHDAAAQAHQPRALRLFICFGGSDPMRMTQRVVKAISGKLPSGMQVDVLIGPGYQGKEALEALCRKPGWTLYATHPAPERLMAVADLAIGAGGIMNYERCALGLPAVVVSIADNQRPTTQALSERGALLYAGHHDSISDAQLSEAVQFLLQDGKRRCIMAGKGLALVDTLGAGRIMRAMRHA
jgi:UDP-2,4-diacetamido-2,4,6-trideoxy-beta-L-altropyranose hydrolase